MLFSTPNFGYQQRQESANSSYQTGGPEEFSGWAEDPRINTDSVRFSRVVSDAITLYTLQRA